MVFFSEFHNIVEKRRNKIRFMKSFLTIFLLGAAVIIHAQLPDYIYKKNIRSITLIKNGNLYSYPALALGSADQLELDFDDMDADIKNYYYSYLLCNADWTQAALTSFDYIRGFQNVRISNYRNSSIAFARYTHYQAMVPDRNCVPSRSGNYLLKVFLDGDTSKLVFTKRFLVVDNRASIAAQVAQPYNQKWFLTYQKLNVGVTFNSTVNMMDQQEAKVVLIQNYAWPTALYLNRPNIFRGNYIEYNDEAITSFPAGKEWRWIDLRSLRLMSDRMQRLEKHKDTVEVFVKPDGDRLKQPYIYYNDLDGIFTIENADNLNPYWQSDYAWVHFSYFPPGNRPYEGQNIYIYGALTNYSIDDSSRMNFNADRGAYEKTFFLKQGYYNYSYVTAPQHAGPDQISIENTEGNNWVTENTYMVLVYFRPFGARADQLIGYTSVVSLFARN